MSASADRLLDQALRLMDELRERCAGAGLGEHPEELLIDGYAAALALEGARRRLRVQALELSQRELGLAAQERELRELLGALRERLGHASRVDGAGPRVRSAGGSHPSGDEPAPQRLH